MSIFDKLVQVDFPADQYVPEESKKTQICLHHTVSPNNSVKGDIMTWVRSKRRVATSIIIGGDGKAHQLFSSRYWAWHLGIKAAFFKKMDVPYQLLDIKCIGIEIDSAGGLTKKDDKWIDVYGYVVKNEDVIEYKDGYRGYYGFQKYTPEQIETVKDLLLLWNDRYGIPLDYKEDMWDVSVPALSGEPGVWSHTSYRSDKSDTHPQPELIEMLKSLTLKTKEGNK